VLSATATNAIGRQVIAANVPAWMARIILAALPGFFASIRPRVVSTQNSLNIPIAPDGSRHWGMATAADITTMNCAATI